MIAAIVIPAWLLLAVLLSRPIYGVLRARSIAKYVKSHPSLYQRDPVKVWNVYDRGWVVEGAVFLALFWPALIPGIPVAFVARWAYRWMTGTKIRSGYELAAERDAMKTRITELERELLQ